MTGWPGGRREDGLTAADSFTTRLLLQLRARPSQAGFIRQKCYETLKIIRIKSTKAVLVVCTVRVLRYYY